MARLVLTTPEGQQTVDLRPRNTLGRHPNNSIQLLDKIVSKEHCVIVERGGAYVLQDLGSLNGTFVGGERVVGERELVDGDEIAMGSTRARFIAGLPHANPPNASWPAPAQPAGLSPLESAHTFQLPPGGPTGTQPIPAQTRHLANQTRVDMSDAGRAIGNQIDATAHGFQTYAELANNPAQLSADYERLRLSHELSREIALERDLHSLLNKILQSVFRFIRADRGVIFLRDAAQGGELLPCASLRRDGSSDAISVSQTILQHVMRERATVLTHDAAMDFAGSQGRSMILHRISSAIVAPLLHNDDLLGVLWLDSETLAQFQAKDLEMVTSIAAQAAMFIEINILGRKLQQEAVTRERFSRLLSPNVAEKVLSGDMIVEKGGQLVDCTVFNSDIRGFTRMSEGADPEAVVELLNEYFEHMVETIFRFEGTLDKFMGDGIMALWGAPVAHPDDAPRAVASAIEQLRLLSELNTRRRGSTQLPPIEIGIGIHTGKVVAGYIGSSRALSYTVIGDTANTSARLCGVAGPGQLLVSEATLAELGAMFQYRELEPVQLKGKRSPFRIFEILHNPALAQVPAGLSSRPPG